MTNPLITDDVLSLNLDISNLSKITFEDAITYLIKTTQTEHELTCQEIPTYFNLFEKHTSSQKLSKTLHLLKSLLSLTGNDEYRELEEKYSGEIIGLLTKTSLDIRAFEQLDKLRNSSEFETLDETKQKAVLLIIKELKREGINLPQDKKEKLSQLNQEISHLRQSFEKNIVEYNSSLGFSVPEDQTEGLTPRIIANAKSLAKEQGKTGLWIDYTSGLYQDVLQNSENEDIRKRIYLELNQCGSHPDYNNQDLIDSIYKKLQEKAEILGYKNYAEMSLEDSMAKTTETVSEFLNKLGDSAMPFAVNESASIENYGKSILNKNLNFWDKSFVLKKYEKEFFDIDYDEIREYFPVDSVIEKTFKFISETFDIKFVPTDTTTWNTDVKHYNVFDNQDKHLGSFYLDIYMRSGKMSGAWLDPIISRRETANGDIIKPVSFMVCNAPKDSSNKSTFTLDEVVTLFHELGHLLHHTLTQINHPYFSGLNNVQHDAVEFPSQLLENFVYNPNVLKKITEHTSTQLPIPDELINKILNHKTFLGASTIVRFVQFSEMDLELYSQKEKHPLTIETEMKNKWKYQENIDPNSFRMPHFQHIFGGGYEAGYYAYQWAEVMSLDCLNLFTNHIDNTLQFNQIAKQYKTHVLETGGRFDMAENFYNLTGRSVPEPKHLLAHYGVLKSAKFKI